MNRWLILALLLTPIIAVGQTVRADVEASDYLGSGLGFTYYKPNYNLTGGIGYFENHIVFGASDIFMMHNYTVTAGSSLLEMNIDGGQISLGLTGVQLAKKDADTSLQMFMGSSGTTAYVSAVTSIRPRNFATGAMYKRRFRNVWVSGLEAVDSGQFSTLASAAYQSEHIYWSATGGLLSSKPFLNAGAGYRNNWFSIRGSHQEWLTPYKVTGDGINTSVHVNHFLMSAGASQSRGRANVLGVSVGAGFNSEHFMETSTYYKSAGNPYFFHSITERVGKFTLSQNIQQTSGRDSYSFGGGYAGNKMSVTVQHEIQFLLNGTGFNRVTSVQFSIRIHDTVVRATTITNPYGKLLWSTDSQSYMQVGEGSTPDTHSTKIGKYVIEGTCQQPDGSVVEGCILEIEQTKVAIISNASGQFELRENKNTALKVRCSDDFVGIGVVQLVSCPATIEPNKSFVVTVERKP